MAKKYFAYPYVLLTRGPLTPGDGEETEEGSVHSNASPCSFDTWLKWYHVDLDKDGDEDEDDYGIWWLNHGFSVADWNEFNPGKDYPTRP